MRGTLETPAPFWDTTFHPMKCEYCDAKAFAIQIPKNLDEYYESLEKSSKDDQVTMFPKLFSSLTEGHYYHYVPLSCAKCGQEVEGMSMFRSLMDLQKGNWKPPKER